jgi:hypothetical protein
MNIYISICLSVLFLTSCTEEKSIETLLNTVHKAMVKQDSVMKAAHDKLNNNHVKWQKEYATVSNGEIDSSNLKLEQAHVDLIEKHDDIIDKHEVILRMHKRLIEKYQKGAIDKDFIEEQHILLEEEYKLMQADHDQLLADHDRLEKDHKKLIENLSTVAKK